jgi:hypothetical protein
MIRYRPKLPALRAPFFLPVVFTLLLVSCGPSFAAFVIPDTTNWRIPMRPVGPDLVSDVVQDGIDTPLVAIPPVYDIVLTWTTPTVRVDASPLLLTEIAGYEINDNGVVIPVGVVTTHTILAASPGAHVLSIRTVDTYTARSAWSPTITVNVL